MPEDTEFISPPPETIVSDFELAIINAASSIFLKLKSKTFFSVWVIGGMFKKEVYKPLKVIVGSENDISF